MVRVLFVDDDQNVLQGLRRILRGFRQEWDMAFANSGKEALDLLAQGHFDIVVSDMRMPQMDGAQLLAEVRRLYPYMVRIVLSGQADKATILKSVKPAHQYLTKPCDDAVLKDTLIRARLLRQLLSDDALVQVVSQIDTLPSLPSLYEEIIEELASEYASLAKIGQIISKDLGMTAKILQLVNSAFFGNRRHIASPAQAAELLGLETLKVLVLSIQIFSQVEDSQVSQFFLHRLWEHSMTTGILARTLAQQEKWDQTLVDATFMAGVLHDVGKLILAVNLPHRYQEAIQLAKAEGISAWEGEQRIFGVSHAETGAFLLALWGLPLNIVEAVSHHHRPRESGQGQAGPLTAVHLGNYWEHDRRGPAPANLAGELDRAYLGSLGIEPKLAAWRAHCLEALQEAD